MGGSEKIQYILCHNQDKRNRKTALPGAPKIQAVYKTYTTTKIGVVKRFHSKEAFSLYFFRHFVIYSTDVNFTMIWAHVHLIIIHMESMRSQNYRLFPYNTRYFIKR